MKPINSFIKSIQLLLLSLLLLLSASLLNKACATHMVGSDLTYTCTGTPGVYHVTLAEYRDCQGTFICTGTCTAPDCFRTKFSLVGADGTCSGTTYGSNIELSLTSVSDVNINPLCPNAKSICDNLGCVTPGTYTPAIEKYIFEGDINFNSYSIPSTCCRVNIVFQDNARNSRINTGPQDQNFYISATVDLCITPCNSSPELTNEPFALICANENYQFNNGAVDPDNDSLTYSFVEPLVGFNQAVTWTAPYAYDNPFNHLEPDNFPFPYGMRCQLTTGDIEFTPIYNLNPGEYFTSVMAIEVTQWRYDANGQPIIAGQTRRDIQMAVVACDPNNPPSFLTDPPSENDANSPKLAWEVCADQTLCFDVIAKDTDYRPFDNPPVSDTTYLSWNESLKSKGATFTPKYKLADRRKPAPLGGPREDIYQFCWTPTEAMASTLPWYFTVSAKDTRCPKPGKATRAIAITVLPPPKVKIKKKDLLCGNWEISYEKVKADQVFSTVTWNISKVPDDYSGTNVNTYLNTATPPVQYRAQGGRYFVELVITTPGPAGSDPCAKSFYDTLIVDTPVTPIVRDTFVCIGNSVTIPFIAKWGKLPYAYRWFLSPDTFANQLNSSAVATTFTVTPTASTRYTLQVRDANGCRGYDSNVVVSLKQLPVFAPKDSQRICPGASYTIDFGNSNGKAVKYQWNTGFADTLQTLTRGDSNTFILQITDSFNCKNKDTFRLYVNGPILANAGLDTSICKGDTATLRGSGGAFYQWRNLTTGNIIQAKGYESSVRVNPTTTTLYEVRVFLSYPDTTAKYLECSKTDTVQVTVNALPILFRPTTIQPCKSDKIVSLGAFTSDQLGGTGSWFYKPSPSAVTATNQVVLDSLKNIPVDTLNYPSGLDNWISYKYVGPSYLGGCTSIDSALIKVYANPYVVAGFGVTWCQNAAPFKLEYDPSRLSPYNTWDRSPYDLSGRGNGEEWTGNGVKTILNSNGPGSKRFEFDATLGGVSSTNILTYKYTLQYPGIGAPSCEGKDTVIFNVIPAPIVDAGSLKPICNNEPAFALSPRAGATTNSGAAGFWTYAPVPVAQRYGIDSAMKDSQNFVASKITMPAAQSDYSWKLYYNDFSTGCNIKDSVTITVKKIPVVTLTLTDSVMCRKTGAVSLQASNDIPGGTTKYSSSPTTSAYAQDPSDPSRSIFNTDETTLTAGTYALTYTYAIPLVDTAMCRSSATKTVVVEEPPVLSITTPGPICAKDSMFAPLVATLTPASYSLVWSHLGAGHWLNNDNTSLSVNYVIDSAIDVPAGTIQVNVTTVKTNSCPVATATTTLTIYPQPNADFICNNCEGCEPLSPVLEAVKPTNGMIVSYDWIVDGTTQNQHNDILNLLINNYGTHNAQVRFTTPDGCAATSVAKPIKVHAIPVADFDPDPPYTTVARPYFDFINKSYAPDGAAMSYLWNFGPFKAGDPDRTSTDVNPKSITYMADTMSRPVNLKVKTIYGCSAEYTSSVRIDPDITVFIPNAFYPGSGVGCPNGDQDCNTVFKVAASGYMTIEVFVFNRWGQQLFYTNDAKIGWNGTINNKENGDPCQQDVYIYQVNATSFSGKAYKYSGSLTLLR